MNIAWYEYLGEIVATALLGLAVFFIFARHLCLPWAVYLITAAFRHIAVHIAGVLHGLASVTQLPSHYQS